MKRRVFLKKTAVAAGAAGSAKLLFPFTAHGMGSEESLESAGTTPGPGGAVRKDIRSADYLRRVRGEKYVPGPPVFAESLQSPAVKVTPMSLAERLRRNIVPRHGFCSTAPGTAEMIGAHMIKRTGHAC